MARKGHAAGRIARRTALALLCFGLGGAAGLCAVFYYLSFALPPLGPLAEGYAPPQTTRILAADGTVIGELFVERRTVVPFDAIPDVMVDAVVAAEDADFFRHQGLDYSGMIRALVSNLISGRISQGASTITQQVARTFFLTRERTFTRKIREILLTKRIEEQLCKEDILFLYLNQINFGHARYGVAEAARFYFGKKVGELDLAEAALLAGIPKGPALFSPFAHPEAALERRAYVLGEMAKHKMITRAAAAAARQAKLELRAGPKLDPALAAEAVDRAVQELADVADREALRRGGYTIETTLDPGLQRAAREAAVRGLAAIDRRQGRLAPFAGTRTWPDVEPQPPKELRQGRTYLAEVIGHDDGLGLLRLAVGKRIGSARLDTAARYNPDRLSASRFAPRGARLPVSLAAPARGAEPLDLHLEIGPQAAVAVVSAADGRIVALVGGDAVQPGGFDRSTAALRQPGSAFKPFVYLAAIRSGRYTAASILDDSPEVLGEWQPKNAHEGGFAGPVRLRDALARSLNLPAVKLLRDVTPEAVVELARALGITSPLDPTPALALGASAVTPLDMASAYATLAAAGRHRRPWIVKRVVGPDGVEVPLVGRSPEEAATPQESFLMTSLLASVIEEGTGSRARLLKRPAAGKTGTSNDQRDAWFVGYTPDLSCAVWVGYDDLRPIGRKEYGAQAALPIWLDLMKRAVEGTEVRDFLEPEGMVRAEIDPRSGLLAYDGLEAAVEEVFIEGTEPTEQAVPPDLVTAGSLLADQLAGDAGAAASH